MARLIPRQILSFNPIRTILYASVCCLAASSAYAQSGESSADEIVPTHRVFVDSCLRELSGYILSGFTPNRTSPLVIIKDTVADPRGSLASGIAQTLSARGLLIREDSAAYSDEGNWNLRYELSPIEITLTEPQRREFLGKIWVKRSMQAEIDMTVQDNAYGDVVWAGSADSTFTDWIPKGAVKSLESPELKPKAPATGWEKAKLPMIVGGGALLAGSLMLLAN